MYGVEATLEKVGYAINIPSNRELAGILAKAASKTSIQQVIDFNEFKAGSEDATFLMKKSAGTGWSGMLFHYWHNVSCWTSS